MTRLRALRETIHTLVRAAMAGADLPDEDVSALNEAAADTPLAPVLDAVGAGHLGWYSTAVDPAIATIARDAVDLLVHGPITRIKECGGADCSLLFFDDSQAGRRRWCSMDRCGKKAKVHAYRTRTP